MKNIQLIFIILFFANTAFAQVGINNTNPQAALDITAGVTPSNTDGILIPRVDEYPTGMTTAQDGMLAFLTGAGTPTKGFYYYSDGVGWLPLIGTGGAANTLDQSYDEGGAGAGKNIDATDGAVRINGTDGILITGTLNAGNTINTEITGAGTRMFFNPNTGSFRAGQVDGNQWDHVNLGDRSVAFGNNNTASGNSSTALGANNVASGNRSVAMGDDGLASGQNSVTMGDENDATGNNSFAQGFRNTASGANASALGVQNNATSFSEMTVGTFASNYTPNSTTAWNAADRVFTVGNGENTGTRGNALTVYKDGTLNINDAYDMPTIDGTVGQVMTTDGAGNVTFQTVSAGGTDTDDQQIDVLNLNGTDLEISLQDDGVATEILDLSSLQDGNTQNTLDQAYDEGGAGAGAIITATDGAVTINGEDGLVVSGALGSGATINPGSNSQMFFNPNKAAFRAGYTFGATWHDANVGEYSFAAGYQNIASGSSSTSMGSSSEALGSSATAIGDNAIASGNRSVAMGFSSEATSLGAVAIGYGAEATGSFSTAMGQLNTASGNNSFTAGVDNVASGLASSSIGSSNISSGNFTTARGTGNTASGISSIAMGSGTVASGANSVSLGIENTAPSYAETVIGAYSTTYTPLSAVASQSADRVFTVGNGTTDVNRSNALTVYKSGLVNINEEYDMPLTDGAAGQVMTTDGAGNVSFQTVSGGGGGSGWEITGNAGTNPATNFFGTTDAQPVALRLNNQEAGLLDGINNNYFIGTDAGSATAPNAAGVGLPTQQGGNNIGLGVGALISNTTGFQNTALGHYTMASLTTGAYNVGIGFRASINNIDGSFNTSIGFEAATFNLSAENNVAIGRSSLYNALSGENNIGVGAYAGHAYDAGDHNTFLGYRAGYSPSGGTTGSNNVMIGANVGLNTASLSNKLMIDSNSAYNPTLLPLIYGEFDNDIVRINGALQVNNPAGTGYALPTIDGTNGQVITTNGTGQLQWANDNISTASNGLTETSGNIILGGALTNNTTINQGTRNMHFQMTSPGTADFRVIRGGGGNLLDINNTGVIAIGDISVLATNEPQFQVNGAAVEDFMASFTQNANNLDTDGIKIILRQETPNSLSNYVGFFKDLGAVQAGGITANFATGGVNYATTSDRRLKTKIKDINNSLELINKIQPRIYEYKANLGAIEYGFIAQELKEQFPQAVSGSPEGDVKKEPMMVDYGRLTPLLTAGIKELNQEIKNLKEENNILKDKLSKLEQLEARLAAIEKSTNNFGNANANNIPARLAGGFEEKK